MIRNFLRNKVRIIKNLSVSPAQPDFLIVGAQKAGTTSLHFYLSQHEKLSGSVPKEIHYFDREDNFNLGDQWYRNHFKDHNATTENLYFEGTPDYLYRSFSAEKIYQFNLNMKIIILLREPVARAYSAWNMFRDFKEGRKGIPDSVKTGYIKDLPNNIYDQLYRNKEGFPSFKECVNMEMSYLENSSSLEEPSFVRRGIYVSQIEKYLSLFPSNQVKILGFRDLIDNKVQTLNEILNFLNIESSEWKFLKDEPRNARSYNRQIDEETQSILEFFYEPFNEKLFQLIQGKPNW